MPPPMHHEKLLPQQLPGSPRQMLVGMGQGLWVVLTGGSRLWVVLTGGLGSGIVGGTHWWVCFVAGWGFQWGTTGEHPRWWYLGPPSIGPVASRGLIKVRFSQIETFVCPESWMITMSPSAAFSQASSVWAFQAARHWTGDGDYRLLHVFLWDIWFMELETWKFLFVYTSCFCYLSGFLCWGWKPAGGAHSHQQGSWTHLWHGSHEWLEW